MEKQKQREEREGEERKRRVDAKWPASDMLRETQSGQNPRALSGTSSENKSNPSLTN